MPMDEYFRGSTKAVPVLGGKFRRRRAWMKMHEPERFETVQWISRMADWQVSFDFTFGTGSWQGRRHGRRKDVRDGLLVHRRYSRGRDADDALDLFRKFMHRVLPGRSWVAAIEPNRCQWLNPGCHGHAMIASDDEIFRKAVQKAWVKENGWGKVNLIRSKVRREDYCTKHLVGRGLIFGFEVLGGGLLSPQIESAL